MHMPIRIVFENIMWVNKITLVCKNTSMNVDSVQVNNHRHGHHVLV